jgi:beta-glucanase (GH16 family)
MQDYAEFSTKPNSITQMTPKLSRTHRIRIPLTITLLTSLVAAQPAVGQVPDGYVLTFADEFSVDGPPDPNVWTHELGAGGWGNNERQNYTDSLDNSRVENGNLIIEVRQESGGRSPVYTSARLVTRGTQSWKYGYFEIRAKMPTTTGTWPAIWMLAEDHLFSDDAWPDNGEIDIMEAVGYEADPLFRQLTGNPQLPNVHGTIHTTQNNGLDNQGLGGSTFNDNIYSEFQTYSLHWTPEKMDFQINGQTYFTVVKQDLLPSRNPPDDASPWWPFDQRFHMILNIAVGGGWGGHFNSSFYPNDSPYGTNGIDDDGVWPQQMLVDYVRVYQSSEPDPATPVPGMVKTVDLDESDGMVLRLTENLPDVEHSLAFIGAGETARFAIENTMSAGTYAVSAWVASPGGDPTLNLSIEETQSTLSGVQVPVTGDYQNWQEMTIGNLVLPEGRSNLILSTDVGNFNLAAFTFERVEGSTWKGWPVTETGDVFTGDWLGWINVDGDPWLYSYKLQNWMYPALADEPVFTDSSQWFFILR